MSKSPRGLIELEAFVILLFACLVAAAAAVLTYVSDAGAPRALLTGGAAWAAGLMLAWKIIGRSDS